MNFQNFKQHKIFFKNFVKKYLLYGDEQYRIKIAHTGDVVTIISKLGQQINLTTNELYLAQLSALYHDIGRFIQFEKYHTFKDHLSVDHALLSLAVIEEYNIFTDIPLNDYNLIKTVILEHNKKEISENLTTREAKFTKLLRDADKLSNLAIVLRNYHKFKTTKVGFYNKNLLAKLLNCQVIDIADVKTMEDYYIYHLSWINDLNYQIALDFAIEAKYIEKISKKIHDSAIKERIYFYFLLSKADIK